MSRHAGPGALASRGGGRGMPTAGYLAGEEAQQRLIDFLGVSP